VATLPSSAPGPGVVNTSSATASFDPLLAASQSSNKDAVNTSSATASFDPLLAASQSSNKDAAEGEPGHLLSAT
jgi:hypothetical protein